MKHIFSVLLGIVGKKGVKELKAYVDTNDKWSYEEQEHIVDFFSFEEKLTDQKILDIIDKRKMRSFMIWHMKN